MNSPTTTPEHAVRSVREILDMIFSSMQKVTPSREVSLAITNLQESKMWLGKLLQEIIPGKNPYPESKNPGNEKIEPTAEKSPRTLEEQWKNSDFSHIQKVKDLRQRIDNQLAPIWDFKAIPVTHQGALFTDAAWMSAQMSMMWLGMELGRIHDVESKPQEPKPV